jgi:predicted Zn finger-like uncharacterized protein
VSEDGQPDGRHHDHPAETPGDSPSGPSKTRCPDCRTAFFVSEAQLSAREGFVRCGRCGALFNARLHPVDPPQAAILPMAEAWSHRDIAQIVIEAAPPVTPEITETHLAGGDESTPEAPAEIPGSTSPADFSPIPASEATPAFRVRKKAARWAWTTASLVLGLGLAIQALWWFRGDIAARSDLLRGPLVRLCKTLACEVPLPTDPDRLVLLSSELESDPDKASRITLHAVIANQASFLQAYPHLELTLTDTAERVVARKVFRPQDYLAEKADPATGMRARSETDVKLRLALDDFTASGYQIELFFP